MLFNVIIVHPFGYFNLQIYVTSERQSSASMYDATCTWRGQLPPRSHNIKTLSIKVFLGGVPWDITEQNLVQAFRPFGNIRIEWPGGKDAIQTVPKGYLYIIFEQEKQVRNLLSACTQDFSYSGSGSWYYKVIFNVSNIMYISHFC